MRRLLPVTVLVLSSVAAQAESPEPSREAIAHAAASCTAEGAFGHRFGETARAADAAIAPFHIEALSARRDGLFEITAAAWFGKAPMSGEDRVALTNWVFRALDTEAGRRGFAKREARRDGVTYHSNADVATGYVLDLSHDQVTVRITCTDVALKRRARTEMREDQ